jgi:hypothetical protein
MKNPTLSGSESLENYDGVVRQLKALEASRLGGESRLLYRFPFVTEGGIDLYVVIHHSIIYDTESTDNR